MFTSSGLLIKCLEVFEKSNYSLVKWIRYITRAGHMRYPKPFPDISETELTDGMQIPIGGRKSSLGL